MKQVGIITMHRVINYGSALQAWATQNIINQLGYSATIIDYIYPNNKHLEKTTLKKIIKNSLRFCIHCIQGFPQKKKRKAFAKFWKNNYHLTKTYFTAKEISKTPPNFDIYLAGSDQIWNPKQIKGDDVFLLGFVPQGKKRISYASSFAQDKLDEKSAQTVKKCLKYFSYISVRENNGASIIYNLLNKEVKVCLDPTLLLSHKDYSFLEKQSSIRIDKPYMLIYILQYAYNPYPYATEFIKKAYKQSGLHIVCLDFSVKQHLGIKDITHLRDSVGPAEFIYLFANASLIITTSFHGTAFALNFQKPFYSILNNESTADDRMKSLIDNCGVNERGIIKDTDINTINIDTNIDRQKISNFLNISRKEALDYLKEALD